MKASGNVGEFTVLDLTIFHYCPREFYFYKKLGFRPLPQKKMEFAKGQHEREKKREHRRKVTYGFPSQEIEEVLHDVPVENPELGLCGKIDTVLKLKNGRILPVETKYSDLCYPTRAWRKQIIAYVSLLEKTLKQKVTHGLLYFLPSKRALLIEVRAEEKRELERDVERMREILLSDSIPRPIAAERCKYCEVARYCKRI